MVSIVTMKQTCVLMDDLMPSAACHIRTVLAVYIISTSNPSWTLYVVCKDSHCRRQTDTQFAASYSSCEQINMYTFLSQHIAISTTGQTVVLHIAFTCQ